MIILYVYLDIALYIISAYDLEEGKAEYFILKNLFVNILHLHHKEQQKRIFKVLIIFQQVLFLINKA